MPNFRFYIDLGAGDEEFYPLHEKCTFTKRIEGRVRERHIFTGELTFYDNSSNTDYTDLLAFEDVEDVLDIRIDQLISQNPDTYTTIANGKLNLNGRWDKTKEICHLTVELTDDYTEINKKFSEEFNLTNVNNVDVQTIKVQFESQEDIKWQYNQTNEGTPQSITDYEQRTNPPVNSPPDWLSTTSFTAAVSRVAGGDTVWEGGNTQFCTHNNVAYRCILANINQEPPNGTYWSVTDPDIEILDPTTLEFVQQRLQFEATGYTYDEDLRLWIKGSQTQETVNEDILYARELYDILEYLLSELDSSILIAQTGANEYSNYLNAKGQSGGSNDELKYLFLVDKIDFKNWNTASYTPVAKSNLSFERLMGLYKDLFNLDWYIDASGYFKLIHPTEIPLTGIDFDLTTLLSTNWSLNLSEYTYTNIQAAQEEWRFEKSIQTDFDSGLIVYDTERTEELIYSNSDLNQNINKVMNNDSDVEDFGNVVCACELDGADFIVIEKDAILGTGSLPNGKLATHRLLIEHHLDNRPFLSGTVNGTAYALVKKPDRQQVDIKAPVNNFTDFDPLKFVKTDLSSRCEKIEVSLPLNGDFAVFKLNVRIVAGLFLINASDYLLINASDKILIGET
jgi:hypothetical protein